MELHLELTHGSVLGPKVHEEALRLGLRRMMSNAADGPAEEGEREILSAEAHKAELIDGFRFSMAQDSAAPAPVTIAARMDRLRWTAFASVLPRGAHLVFFTPPGLAQWGHGTLMTKEDPSFRLLRKQIPRPPRPSNSGSAAAATPSWWTFKCGSLSLDTIAGEGEGRDLLAALRAEAAAEEAAGAVTMEDAEEGFMEEDDEQPLMRQDDARNHNGGYARRKESLSFRLAQFRIAYGTLFKLNTHFVVPLFESFSSLFYHSGDAETDTAIEGVMETAQVDMEEYNTMCSTASTSPSPYEHSAFDQIHVDWDQLKEDLHNIVELWKLLGSCLARPAVFAGAFSSFTFSMSSPVFSMATILIAYVCTVMRPQVLSMDSRMCKSSRSSSGRRRRRWASGSLKRKRGRRGNG